MGASKNGIGASKLNKMITLSPETGNIIHNKFRVNIMENPHCLHHLHVSVSQTNEMKRTILRMYKKIYIYTFISLTLPYCSFPSQVMEDDEELLLPLSGPLVMYMPVWHPVSLSWG